MNTVVGVGTIQPSSWPQFYQTLGSQSPFLPERFWRRTGLLGSLMAGAQVFVKWRMVEAPTVPLPSRGLARGGTLP